MLKYHSKGGCRAIRRPGLMTRAYRVRQGVAGSPASIERYRKMAWPSPDADSATLIHRGRRLKIDLLPLALDDAGANLRSRLARLVQLIRVVEFLQARGAPGTMRAFEAAMQARSEEHTSELQSPMYL